MGKTDYPTPPDIREAYEEALRLREINEQWRAREAFLGLLARYPKEPRLLLAIGNTYIAGDNEIEKAEPFYLKALQYAPDFAPLLSNISSLYSRLERYEEAAEYARRAIRAETSEAAPWLVLGLYYARKGEVGTGLDYFGAAYSRGGDKALAAYNIGCALTELGRIGEAFQYIEEAVNKKRIFEKAKNDSTLDSLRELPEFKAIMSKAESRFLE